MSSRLPFLLRPKDLDEEVLREETTEETKEDNRREQTNHVSI